YITSRPQAGLIDIGPLNDSSGLKIWGGKPLRDDLQTSHGFNQPYANYGKAQELGYAVIEGPQYEDDRNGFFNLLWAVGAGKGPSGCTLRTYMGTVTTGDGFTPAAGVTRTQYDNGGRYYYFGPTKTAWTGEQYQIVAAKRNVG